MALPAQAPQRLPSMARQGLSTTEGHLKAEGSHVRPFAIPSARSLAGPAVVSAMAAGWPQGSLAGQLRAIAGSVAVFAERRPRSGHWSAYTAYARPRRPKPPSVPVARALVGDASMGRPR